MSSVAYANHQAEQRVVLGNISWELFVQLAESADSPRGRFAYEKGVLEITSPSMMHESIKGIIGRMIETFSFERNIEIRTAGSTTLTRRDLENGVEADECYYIANAETVRRVAAIDLKIHPPPDLVVEVDINNSSAMKLGICLRIGVPEVWRYTDGAIHLLLRKDDSYQESDSSVCLPDFPLAFANDLLGRRLALGETELIRKFQAEIR